MKTTIPAPAMQVSREEIFGSFIQTYFFANRPQDKVTVRVCGKKVEISSASQNCNNATEAMMFAQLWMYAAQFAATQRRV